MKKNAYSQYGLYYTKAVFLLFWIFHNIGKIVVSFFIVKMNLDIVKINVVQSQNWA